MNSIADGSWEMKLEISLAPSGAIRLHLPNKVIKGIERHRTLDIEATPQGLAYILKMLRDVESGRRDRRGHIGQFPTQHVIDALALQAKQQQAEDELKAASERLGVDIKALEITI
jgi:hypothetical protein